MNKELIEKYKTCKNEEELILIAKKEGYKMSKDKASALLRYFSSHELNEDELINATGGGCSGDPSDIGNPKYQVGQKVKIWFEAPKIYIIKEVKKDSLYEGLGMYKYFWSYHLVEENNENNSKDIEETSIKELE